MMLMTNVSRRFFSSTSQNRLLRIMRSCSSSRKMQSIRFFQNSSSQIQKEKETKRNSLEELQNYKRKDQEFPVNLSAFKIIPEKSRSQILLIQKDHPDFGNISIKASLQDNFEDEDPNFPDDSHDDISDYSSEHPERISHQNDLENPQKDEAFDPEDNNSSSSSLAYDDAAQSSTIHMLVRFKYKGYNMLIDCRGPAANCCEDGQFQTVESRSLNAAAATSAVNDDYNSGDYLNDYDEDAERMAGRDFFSPTSLIISADEIPNQIEFADDESLACLFMEDLNEEQQEKVNEMIEKIGLYSFSEEITNILIKHKENLLMNQLEILSKL
ncbi:MAG: hypothetical protein MHMPM18_001077 [Marteilia pararefringens]